MAKLTGPVFSLTARGTIAKAITYSMWRGIAYSRARVVPANPRTLDQVEVREIFKTLCAIWNRLPAIGREPWVAQAIGNPHTDRNKFIALNVAPLQGDADLQDMAWSPGMGGAVPPVTVVATPGALALSIAVTAPPLPAGWTITGAQAVAVLDGDPNPAIAPTPVAAEDLSTPYAVVLSGLTNALHVYAAWLKWLSPTGDTRYSLALGGTATPQAA